MTEEGLPASLSADRARLTAALPFAVSGATCIVVGGLVAAATAPAPSEHGSWAAAYLVLVAGVAQLVLGVGQAALAAQLPSRRVAEVQALAWNLGNAAVIAGTLLGVTTVVDAGGALLVGALVLFVRTSRTTERTGGEALKWARHAFRSLVVLLCMSIPIGLALAQLRSH